MRNRRQGSRRREGIIVLDCISVAFRLDGVFATLGTVVLQGIDAFFRILGTKRESSAILMTSVSGVDT